MPKPKLPMMTSAAGETPFAAILDDCFAVLGKRGSGKSNVRQLIFEYELDAGHRCVLIDPKGDSYGTRMKPDGEPSRFDVPILGGRHGDYPLNVNMAEKLGEMVATHKVSCILDLSDFYLEEQRTFMLPFARTLLHHNRNALTLLIEEADLLAPQIGGGQSGPTHLVNAMGALVKVGRQRGIIAGMFTQRPQSLNKNLLSQIDSLVALKVTSPRDRDAFKDWFVAHSEEAAKEVLTAASRLAVGEGYVWLSSVDFFGRVQFPMHSTYDSGRAPVHGESADDVALKPLKSGAFAKLLAPEPPKSQDPAAIAANPKLLTAKEAEIGRLGAEVQRLQGVVEQSRPSVDALRRLKPAVEQAWRTHEALGRAHEGHGTALDEVQKILESVGDAKVPVVAPKAIAPVKIESARGVPAAPRADASVPVPGGEVPTVPHGCAKPLKVLANVYPTGMSEKRWATAAGFKMSGGTWRTYRGRLAAANLIEKRGDEFFATADGANSVPGVDLEIPAPGPDLARWWGGKIHGTPRLIEVLIPEYPGWMPKADLAAALGMEESGGSFRTYIGRLASPGFLEKDGDRVRLSPEIMG